MLASARRCLDCDRVFQMLVSHVRAQSSHVRAHLQSELLSAAAQSSHVRAHIKHFLWLVSLSVIECSHALSFGRAVSNTVLASGEFAFLLDHVSVLDDIASIQHGVCFVMDGNIFFSVRF